MDLIWNGIVEALRLLFGGDGSIYEIAWRALWISGLALVIAVTVGVPLGAALALNEFGGRRVVVAVTNTGMAAPPVVVGLLVSLFLTRNGPVGDLRWLYTPWAMVIAQVVIALPIVMGLSLAALQQIDVGLRQQIAALGAGRLQGFVLLLREIKVALLAAVMAAFGGVISEVGAVMMVGGNIEGQTQVLTTAIVQETRIGRWSVAIALSIILMILAFGANFAMTVVQQQGRRSTGSRRREGRWSSRAARSRRPPRGWPCGAARRPSSSVPFCWPRACAKTSRAACGCAAPPAPRRGAARPRRSTCWASPIWPSASRTGSRAARRSA